MGEPVLIAIPMVGGKVSMHFGHCEEFALVEADKTSGKINSMKKLAPPVHQPGMYPRWLADFGVNVIISGGMGPMAQELFRSNGIEVVLGVSAGQPELLASSYLTENLETGDNTCDH